MDMEDRHFDRRAEETVGEPLSAETRQHLLDDLDTFVARVKQSVEEGTFLSAIFTVMVDTGEDAEGGEGMVTRVTGFRHGFSDATAVLMQDTIDRYADATFGEAGGLPS